MQQELNHLLDALDSSPPTQPIKEEAILLEDSYKFFIAICDKRDNIFKGRHSFIMAGIEDPLTGLRKVLCTIGKRGDENIPLLSDHHPAGIFQESFILKDSKDNSKANPHHISYKAFSIEYQDYLHLIAILATHNKEALNYAFIPAGKDQRGRNILYFNKGIVDSKYMQHEHISLLGTANTVNRLTNNCRHTAIEILEEILARKNIRDVGSYFKPGYTNFPYTTYIKGNNVSHYAPFFTFPPEPGPDISNKQLLNVLNLMYKRLEDVAKKWQTKKETLAKFDMLKEIYEQTLAQANQKMGLVEILKNILDYQKQNKKLIDEPRRGGLFCGQTETSKLFEKFNTLYKEISQKSPIKNTCLYNRLIYGRNR